jgi:hypothetical protein
MPAIGGPVESLAGRGTPPPARIGLEVKQFVTACELDRA